MGIKIYTMAYDNVITSTVITGETTYGYALEKLFPLINRFSAQRELQNKKFYERLKSDILAGCLMPPITLAMISDTPVAFDGQMQAEQYANSEIEKGYVLDGMQRLNTLNSIRDEEGFDITRPLYLSIIISTSKDSLLYRMITLNNGQKPMTPRHQIEVLAEELFSFVPSNIEVVAEKDRSEKMVRGAFSLADITKGYLAFVTNSVHNENNKIISDKMDEIIVGKIMDAGVDKEALQFNDVLVLIDKLAENKNARLWLKTSNNLIGFCVGIKKSFSEMENISSEDFKVLVDKFEGAFKGINVTKVNLGKYRRELSRDYITNIAKLGEMSDTELLSYFSEQTAS